MSNLRGAVQTIYMENIPIYRRFVVICRIIPYSHGLLIIIIHSLANSTDSSEPKYGKPPQKLLDQVRDAIRVGHDARNTDLAFVYCLTFLIWYQACSAAV